ncbi:hypothetical protein PUN28_016827 [Cardiocondyla obscurior]|uniref:Secreted protein n=1 Tax=Cardiocondyla obscurior TaxID=286306 RepID=A0AAW2ENX2_9HYME
MIPPVYIVFTFTLTHASPRAYTRTQCRLFREFSGDGSVLTIACMYNVEGRIVCDSKCTGIVGRTMRLFRDSEVARGTNIEKERREKKKKERQKKKKKLRRKRKSVKRKALDLPVIGLR